MTDSEDFIPGITIAMDMSKPTSRPFNDFMDWVVVEYYGYKPGDPSPEQRAAVRACYRRFGRAAKDIMAFALSDPKVARRGVEAIGARMEQSGLSWNLDTVARWFPDWMVGPEVYENETKNNNRVRR